MSTQITHGHTSPDAKIAEDTDRESVDAAGCCRERSARAERGGDQCTMAPMSTGGVRAIPVSEELHSAEPIAVAE